MACVVLIILGGIAQIVGFGLTYYELSNTQRREFPDRIPWHHQVLAYARRRLGLRKPQSMTRNVGDSLNISDTASAHVTRSPAMTLPERVGQLEAVVKDLASKQRQDHERLAAHIAKVEQRLTNTETNIEAQEQRRKEALSESLFFQRLGVGFFVVGAILSVLGSTI